MSVVRELRQDLERLDEGGVGKRVGRQVLFLGVEPGEAELLAGDVDEPRPDDRRIGIEKIALQRSDRPPRGPRVAGQRHPFGEDRRPEEGLAPQGPEPDRRFLALPVEARELDLALGNFPPKFAAGESLIAPPRAVSISEFR